MMPDQSAVMGILYLAAVAFFALWRCEKARGDELLRALWETIDRHQMARLRAREAAELDAIREIV